MIICVAPFVTASRDTSPVGEARKLKVLRKGFLNGFVDVLAGTDKIGINLMVCKPNNPQIIPLKYFSSELIFSFSLFRIVL